MEILGERPAWSMTDSEKLSRLDATVAEVNRLKTYCLHLVGDLDASGYAKDIGAGDTARFLSLRYRIDSVEARRDVRLAKGLAKYEAVAAALPDPAHPYPRESNVDADPDADADAAEQGGDTERDAEPAGGDSNTGTDRGRAMHPAQAAAIVSALEKVPDTVAVENIEAAERQLVKLARTFTPGQLRDAAQRIRNILDTDGLEPDEKRAYQRESLTLKPADNGVRFGGYLANENAELFRTLIHSGAKPHKTIDGEPDPRARDKRQADALTTLLTTAAGVTHTTAAATTTTTAGPGPGNSTAGASAHSAREDLPQVDNAARHDTSSHDRSSHDGSIRDRSSHDGAGGETFGQYIPGHGPKAHLTITIDYNALKAATASAVGETVFGDDLSAAAVRRLACDAQVIPVVLGSKSQPLDVGTTKRLVTAPMRLALNARDRGCVVCGAPPIHCEAHHLVHWIDGGATCVSNLVLLCKRHHLDLHTGHWRIEIIDDIVHVTRPDWANPDPVPPGRFRPPIHHGPANGSPDAAGRTWTPATTRHHEATPAIAHQAIWGDSTPTAEPVQSLSPPPPPPPPPGHTADPGPPARPWSRARFGGRT